VEQLGVLAEAGGEAQDGVEADAGEAGGGAAPDPFGQVPRDGDQGVLVGAEAEQWGVGALGEVLAAGGAAEAADALVLGGPAVRAQVGCPAPAVVGAIGVGAGQVREVLRAHR
jgi:hypothetical protein